MKYSEVKRDSSFNDRASPIFYSSLIKRQSSERLKQSNHSLPVRTFDIHTEESQFLAAEAYIKMSERRQEEPSFGIIKLASSKSGGEENSTEK